MTQERRREKEKVAVRLSESEAADALSLVTEKRKETFVGEGHSSWEV